MKLDGEIYIEEVRIMGLENGICIKKETVPFGKMYKIFGAEYQLRYDLDLEICYWRKCHNIRDDIFDVVDEIAGRSYSLSVDHIKAIISILKTYNRNNWVYGTYYGSIWSWNEIRSTIKRHIRNLKKLIKYMEKYPTMEVYFYDSY